MTNTMNIGKDFMEKTKYRKLDQTDQEKGLPQPPLQLEYDLEATLVNLPDVEALQIKDLALLDAINQRKSVRKYSAEALSLEELAYLLWCTQGVKEINSRPVTMRTVPSAGARHSFETYLLINNVKGLKPGLYRYLALEHQLIVIDLDPEIANKIAHAAANQVFIKKSAVTLIWATSICRMKWRYGERGYRYVHLDAGHVCQNLYLASEAVDSGVCAIAAFDDDELNGLLGLDGEEQFVVYLATVGKTTRLHL